jgi:cell division transport system permease protein
LLVKPVEGSDITVVRQLSAQLEADASVARVIVDAQWIERLEQLLRLGARWVEGLGGAMILGAILVVANTLRLSIDACREEIIVVRLLGGSDAFARRPFLYAGLWYGVGGGIVAAVLVWGFGLWLSGPLNALLLLYDRPAQPPWLDPQYLIALLFGAATMGWLASWWVTRRLLSRLDSA